MNQSLRTIVCIAAGMALAGCIATWARVDDTNKLVHNGAFSVELPVGWMRADMLNNRYAAVRNGNREELDVARVVVTRDGLNLQQIDIIRFNPNDAFPHIGKKYTAAMLPSEQAELLIADLKASPGLENLEIVRNVPHAVLGIQGFELHIRFKTDKGLGFERVTYAFGDASGFYIISYQAPSIHYFPKFRAAFERIVQSFRFATRKA